MSINSLKMKNLKCFSEEEGLIRPITIVVGENNTGKTTFLSAYKLMHDLVYEIQPIIYSSIEDFLKKDIYTYLGGHKNIIRKQSDSRTINLGVTIKVSEQNTWSIEYLIENGKTCKKVLISCLEDKIEVNMKENNMIEVLVNSEKIYNATTPSDFPINFFRIISFLSKHLENVQANSKILKSKIATLERFFEESGKLKNISCNFLEPIHLKPKDQYDPTKIKTTNPSYVLSKMAKNEKK